MHNSPLQNRSKLKLVQLCILFLSVDYKSKLFSFVFNVVTAENCNNCVHQTDLIATIFIVSVIAIAFLFSNCSDAL